MLKGLVSVYIYIADICLKWVSAGSSERFDPDRNRKIKVVNLFVFIGGTLTSLLSVRAALSNDWLLAFSLATACALFLSARWLQIIRPTSIFQRISSSLLQLCLMSLTLYLVVSGGNSNTGPLWLYLVPPVCMFLGGFYRGLVNTLLFTSIVALVLFYPENALLTTTYTYEFKTRLLYSFVTTIFLSAFYEYSREQSYAHVENLREQFERLALQDPMTQLPNRRHITEQMKYEAKRISRNRNVFSIVLIDVDHFKNINDTYGHDIGDNVLCHVANRLDSAIRKQDIAARWGGEEFLLMLPDTPIESASVLANKIREVIANTPFELPIHDISVTISAGVAQVDPEANIDQAIINADKRLYEAKQQGRNLVIAHD